MCLQRWPSIIPAMDLIPDELLFHCNYRFITHLYIYIGLMLQQSDIGSVVDESECPKLNKRWAYCCCLQV